MKMRNYYLLMIIISIIITGCNKDDVPKFSETGATINGESFIPTKNEAKKSGDKFIISFEGGVKSIEIITNDTINGTYNIVSQSLKSTTTLKANIIYKENNNEYFGISGAVEVIKTNNTISGSYNAKVKANQATIEINSGSFSGIAVEESIPFIETETAINDTLLLCYSKLQEYMEFLYLFDAIYSNDVAAPNASWSEIYNHTQSPDNKKVLSLWSGAYEIIYKTNLVIISSELAIPDEETRQTIIGYAKAIRAYLFYNLSNWFGEVPLETEIYDSKQARSTIEEVFEQIKKDATVASINLPTENTIFENTGTNKFFAFGLLGRIFLNTEDFVMADSLAENIINSGQYALSLNPNNFSEGDSEIIWGFNKKTNNEFNTFFTKGSFVPVIRYTEVLLIYIEALYRTGKTGGAISFINELRYRRGGQR